MSQDNTQTDTSQQEYKTIEEAVFGEESSENNVESAFTEGNTGNEETAAPEESGQPAQEITPDDNNDDTRYQYWQSQADKLKNENAQLRNAYAQQAQQSPRQAQPQVNEQQTMEEFPPPPQKPQKPRNWNREEAYNDPSSDSAGYLDAVDSWRDDMSEYNTIRSQYDNAVVQEKFDKMENQRVESAKKQEAAQIAAKQQAEISSYVTGHHGMSDAEANDFMTKMSDPASINIDNLVQLYRMQQGNAAPQQSNAPASPSQSFQQTKNAQQVPSPMGVMPSGQSNADGRSMEDKMMDSMVGNFNEKNPWK